MIANATLYGPDSVLLKKIIFEYSSYKTSSLFKCGLIRTWFVKVDFGETITFWNGLALIELKDIEAASGDIL